jgi:IS5 family transposase
VQVARQEGVAEGRKLKTDTTVVESNIHYPTDSSLLGDGIRVLTRSLARIAAQCKRWPLPTAASSPPRMSRRLQAQRRVSSAPGWSRSHLFGRHCQLRPSRTREVTALEVESQINSRNSRRVRTAPYRSRIAVTGFRSIARCAGK